MLKVSLTGSLKTAAGGQGEFTLEARNIRQMFDALQAACPALKGPLEKGVAVSINGQIYRNAWFQTIPEGAEVFILPPMAGG